MEHVKTISKLTHRQRQALATQTLIVETACQLFVERGYHATTIEMIAAEAGVAVSTIYAASCARCARCGIKSRGSATSMRWRVKNLIRKSAWRWRRVRHVGSGRLAPK
jgi:tetracycline repressor-like protein